MRLAFDQMRQRPRTQRPGSKIGHSPLGIGNAAWPAAGIAGVSFGETPERIARARQKWIRINRLRLLNSESGEQEVTGRIGGDYLGLDLDDLNSVIRHGAHLR